MLRQRISLACNACRKKRAKCDGGQPRCSACSTRGQDCEYAHSDNKRKPPSKQYVKALLSRIESLEEKLSMSSLHPQAQTLSWVEPPEQEMFDSFPPIRAINPALESGENPLGPGNQDEVTKKVSGRTGRFHLGADNQLRYFYSRNAQALSSDACISAREARTKGYDAARRLVGIENVSDELRDHLLELFWLWHNSWHYMVPEQPFMQDLFARDSFRFASPALLSAIFAVASRYSDRLEVRTDPNNSKTAGDSFARQAKVMIQFESEAPTTTTVQAAAIISIFEMSVDRESSGWMYCGLSTRMALNLGLHIDCSSCVTSGLIDNEEYEVRNITWWGCYVLDQLHSVGWGKPRCIPNVIITAKTSSRSCDLEYRPWRRSSNELSNAFTPNSRCVSNAHYIVKLFQLTSEILDNSTLKCSETSHITQSHLRLVSFYHHLPSFLKISSSCLKPAMPHVYMLHLQYHVAMILLHRPFLPAFRHQREDLGDTTSQEEFHAEACRSSAEHAANILRIYEMNYTLRRIPIYAVHCALTAATIHLVDTMSHDPTVKRKAMQRLHICVTSMHRMEKAWSSSSRCILSVQELASEWSWSTCDGADGSKPKASIRQGYSSMPRNSSTTSQSESHLPLTETESRDVHEELRFADQHGDREMDNMDAGWLLNEEYGIFTPTEDVEGVVNCEANNPGITWSGDFYGVFDFNTTLNP